MDKEQIIEALKKVEDPELGLDVYTLGLIYAIDIKNKTIKITMTFTSPMCPFGPMLIEMVKQEITALGAEQVDVEITFTPVWQPSEEVKMLLGLA